MAKLYEVTRILRSAVSNKLEFRKQKTNLIIRTSYKHFLLFNNFFNQWIKYKLMSDKIVLLKENQLRVLDTFF